jgi:hypothetical protein
MAKEISDTVYDEALSYIATCTECQVRTSADAVLVTTPALDSGNFTGPAAGSPSGRQITCLVSSTSDMKAISVTSAGAAKRVALRLASTDHVVAELTSAVSLGASDQINLGSFVVVFPDPT